VGRNDVLVEDDGSRREAATFRDAMQTPKTFAKKRPRLTAALLWILAGVATLACFAYQDRTGPTYPLEGEYETGAGPVRYLFLRSETLGRDLAIVLLDPVPEGLEGFVKYRRFRSDDPWKTLPMAPGTFTVSRRGRTREVEGVGAELPALAERAGKVQYFVLVSAGDGKPVSVTGKNPVHARYKGKVPAGVLLAHILAVFASMTLAIRTVLEALVDGRYTWMLWATLVSLLLGAFVLGPLVQLYAFGVWWSGVPFGFDWTDNKVLVELLFWLPAVFLNLGKRRNRASVYVAGAVTLAVYFIPHSLFGSEFDYRTGTGRGTAG